MTTIKPILKYPGAKWNIADWIISCLPPHKHYIEPFFGSGAVFFSKAPAPHEVVNDLSGDVVNLFRVIRERGEELAALIEMTPWAREEYELSYTPTDDPVERARRFVVYTRQRHGGSLGGRVGWSHEAVRVRAVGSHGAPNLIQVWRQLPRRILDMVDRLQKTEIEHRPAVDVIAGYNAPNVLIYADPPYLTSTRRPRTYAHEMTDADHSALLDALDAHPGPVVLSGYHCPLYDDRLAHWYTVERGALAEEGRARIEVLWLNDAARPQQMRLL